MDAERGDPKAVPLDVLRQPIRARILEICTEWKRISPSEMVAYGLCADIESIQHMTDKQALTNIGYHCRRLAHFGFLTLVDVEPKRGATKHYYAANTTAVFHTDEWAKMTERERQAITQVTWHRLVSQVEGSVRQQVFDARTDRWMVWGLLNLDAQGWEELTDGIEEQWLDIERMGRDAEARMQHSGEKPMHVTYALLGFESPRPVGKRRRKPGDRSDPKSRHRSRK